jgi:Flp pilus assembly protein TadG
MWFGNRRARRSLLKRFRKSEKGVTAIEFAMVAGPFLYLLGFIFETGLMLFSEYVIENGVAQASRMIRTGQVQNQGLTQAQFKTLVCGNLASFLNCQSKLYVDVRQFNTFNAIALPQPIVNGMLNPAVSTGAQYQPPQPRCVAVVRVYYEWPLFMPIISQALANVGDKKRLLTAGAAFRAEPFGSAGCAGP